MIKIKRLCESVFEVKLHKIIQKELTDWKKYADGVRKSPLSFLKAHQNVGYQNSKKKYNDYQTNLPFAKVIDSYWLGCVLRACSEIFGGEPRDYRLKFRGGHYDHLDIWINYCEKGSSNPVHNHSGSISGVIYYKNDKLPTIFPTENFKHVGKNNTMILFPSNLVHQVPLKTTKSQRVTFAFNIDKIK